MSDVVAFTFAANRDDSEHAVPKIAKRNQQPAVNAAFDAFFMFSVPRLCLTAVTMR